MLAWTALVTVLALLQGCMTPPGGSPYVRAEAERLISSTLLRLGSEVSESSGLALWNERLWTVNDSGGAAELIWLDLKSSRTGRLPLEGATNFDWEALAQSDEHLYIVDCGNNRGDRIWLQLYQVGLEQLAAASAEVVRTDFRWGDVEYGVNRRAHNNDCEAAAWVGGELWLFTKNWQDLQTRLYRMAPGEDRQTLSSSERFNVDGLITGADFSSDQQMLALIGYGKGLRVLQPFIWLLPVDEGAPNWPLAKRYLLAESGQWEAISWQGSDLLISREESPLGGAEIARVRLPKAALSK